jgi:outer membrane protein assembly factor BamB
MLRELAPRPRILLAARALGLVLLPASASAQWPQWGGPERDFRAPATDLADAWPESGPKKLWERELGPGYSSIVSDGGRLYTLVLSAEEETVVALDAKTGATVWEHPLRAVAGNEPPNSTPLLVGDKLFALGSAGHLCALDKASGKLLWSHDLLVEYKAKQAMFGFAASPLAYRDTLIVPVGGKGFGVAAFALADGKLLWRAHDFEEIYASPLLIEVAGETEVVVLTAELLVGLDPVTGALLWSTPIVNGNGQNIATPVWSSDGLLCVTTGMAGSVAFRLTKEAGKTKLTEVWKNDKQISQTTVVRVGDFYYGSTGDPAQVTAFHAATGAVAWQKDGLSVANVLATDKTLVLLDYDGVLALATATPTGLEIHARTTLLQPQAFTPPTLDGHALYVRDLKHIKALDLGKPD